MDMIVFFFVVILCSSGTTEGRQKFVPFTRHSAQTTLQIFGLAAAYRSRFKLQTSNFKLISFSLLEDKMIADTSQILKLLDVWLLTHSTIISECTFSNSILGNVKR